jgi:hypothetical protein
VQLAKVAMLPTLDIYMHSDYLKYKTLEAKVSKRLEVHRSAINKPIYIRDIAVIADITSIEKEHRWSKGERFSKHHDSETPVMTRLLIHIDTLAAITDRHHQYYCYNPHQEIKDPENHITRLALHEFSLYTPEPFSLTDFPRLIEGIEDIAKKYHENVHLLLSSFAVVTEDKKLLNTCIYVKCGQEPMIHTFCKTLPDGMDVNYDGIRFFYQQSAIPNQNTILSPFVAKDITISHNSVFEVKTMGGSRYLQIISMCRDYFLMHAKKILIEQMKQPDLEGRDILPEQIDHVVTANIVDKLEEKYNFSKYTAHIDPQAKINATLLTFIESNTLNASDLKAIISTRCPKASLTKTTQKYFKFEYPSFGLDCVVIVQKERELGGFTQSDLSQLAKNYNQKVTNLQCTSMLTGSPLTAKYKAYCKQAQEYQDIFKELIHNIGHIISSDEKPELSAPTLYQPKSQLFCDTSKILEDWKENFSKLDPFLLVQKSQQLLLELKKNLQKQISQKNTTLASQLDSTIDDAASQVSKKAASPTPYK